MSGFLDGIERDLVDAARRRRDARRVANALRLRERLGIRRIALAAALFALVGAATAGATLLVLRGSVIPAPAVRDVPPDQMPAPGTARVSELRAADPAPGQPPWTLRLARSTTGLLCTTAGQLVDRRFGLIGLDGRFRAYPERIVDSCGEQVRGARASLIGARVFSARTPADVRTVVSGVAGPRLRAVTLVVRDQRRAVAVGAGGTFVAALRGYPEDSGLVAELRFAGGQMERHDFGTSRSVVLDPEGGRAWRVSAAARISLDRRRCVTFEPARAGRPRALSPAVCGITRRGAPVSGVYFGARRIEPGTGSWSGQFRGEGNWGDHPARTAVWGGFAEDVARIDVLGPDGQRRRPALGARHVFLAVFPASVDPRALVVRVAYRDGRVERLRGDTRLVPPERLR